MTRLAITVDGQTEEEFIKTLLVDHLRPRKVEPTPILLGRARTGSTGGGNVTVGRLVSEMLHLHHSFDAVTSLVDFYGFRDKEDLTVEALEGRLEQKIGEEVSGGGRVFPYVQKHEFEGLLFSDTAAFRTIDSVTDPAIGRLSAVRRQFATPEDIDDGPQSAPSKRVAAAVPGYRKRLHGPRVARLAGLAKICAECPRFCAWLTCLEGLARPARTARAE